MRIKDIKVLRGPNYWSVRRNKLIQMHLDLEEMEQRPTDAAYRERLEKLIPSMVEHRCSEDFRGGFFHRVDEGTWLGHVIEHIALELQTLAGMDTGFGRTRGTGREGEYYVVFSYMEEDAGVYAAKAAVKIAQALADNLPYDLDEDIQTLRENKRRHPPRPINRRHCGRGVETGHSIHQAQQTQPCAVGLWHSPKAHQGYHCQHHGQHCR